MFDGAPIDSDDPFSVMSGMQFNIEPKSIEVTLMDLTTYTAEFIGIDRFTKLGFCRIISEDDKKFKYLKLGERKKFEIGEMLMVHILLPEYVTPPLAADIGMVSAILKEPEDFVLTVGFNELEIGSVLYDSTGVAVGILGPLNNPALSGFDVSSMAESMSQMEDFIPLLGIIDADKVQKLIEDPPERGEITRGWLGIYLQALTTDIAEFWGLELGGGIIVNEVVNNSPADSAGLKTGDIIVELNGQEVKVDREEALPIFQRRIAELGAGAKAEFVILRRQDGEIDTLEISATLTKAPLSPAEAPDYEDENFELTVRDMVFADYNIFKLDASEFKGIVVKEVEPGGWADIGGIDPGDIVQSIDGQETDSVETVKEILKQISKDKPKEVVFFIWRNNKTMFVNIKTDW
jgi:serine protease Do